jgi:hypothetical protein
MKTSRGKWLLSIGLLGGLTGCGDGNPVEVAFQTPFPTGNANLGCFRPRDQNRYYSASDTTETLTLGPTTLVRQQWLTEKVSAKQLDSLGLPHRVGQWSTRLRLRRTGSLAADSFLLEQRLLDTLFVVGGRQKGVLRRHQGWYYLSTPNASEPAQWHVARLAVDGPSLQLQDFNPDSLRIRALDTSAVRLRREPPRLLFIIRPTSRRATHQVSSYAGLWLPLGSYRWTRIVR